MHPPSIWDYEDTGVYDVPTRHDYERWEEERRKRGNDKEPTDNGPDRLDVPY